MDGILRVQPWKFIHDNGQHTTYSNAQENNIDVRIYHAEAVNNVTDELGIDCIIAYGKKARWYFDKAPER